MVIFNKKRNKFKNSKKELKIYYVEDELFYAKLLTANLDKMGFNDITPFESGEELLSHLEDGNKPDILILDYIIKGGMDAFETLTEVKKHNLDINIIILSGQSEVEKATQIIKNGASDYIIKNNMTYFNLENALKKIKNATHIEIEHAIKTKRSKFLYISAIVIIWIVLVVTMWGKIINGF